mgnify:FL=1
MTNINKSFATNVASALAKYNQFNGQYQLFNYDLFLNAQQKFRFVVLLNNIPTAFISQVDRPSYAIETRDYNLLDHVVRYPVRVKWEQITLTIKEIFGGDTLGTVGNNLMNKLLAHSYNYPDSIVPSSPQFGTKNLSKQNLNGALGEMKILSLRPDGTVFETWTIYNGMITSVKFSNHAYSDEGLTDVSLTIQYDWARLELGQV